MKPLMTQGPLATALALLLSLPLAAGAAETDLSGEISVEGRLFAQPSDAPGRDRGGLSVALAPEYEVFFETGQFTLSPFLRADSADPERSHGDLREAYGLWIFDRFELAVGLRKVFWGVTESQHLVDVVNQTDLVENPDGEDKLGQPMVQLTVPTENGNLDLFVLPLFRERTFPGSDGRLRGPLVVDTDNAVYQSGHGRHHIDLAARYNRFFGPWEVGISHFSGTSREPQLIPNGSGGLTPLYTLIEQTGLDVQLILGEWLLKTEAIHRTGMGPGYYAWTTGFEYTFVGIGGSYMDLGVLAEWHRDTRGTSGGSPLEHDVMGGVRLAVNDLASTEVLAGLILDPVIGAHAGFVEASRRYGDRVRLELEARFFGAPPEDLVFHALRHDDFLQATVGYYF